MSTTTLKAKAESILTEKNEKIIPSNLTSDLTIFNVTGNIPVKNSGEGSLSIDTNIQLDDDKVKYVAKTDILYKANSYMSKSYDDVAQAIGLSSSKIKSGETILNIPGSVTELNGQSVEINPTTNQQIIEPESPYNGIIRAVVSPVTSSIDNNISTNNIKSGVTILGVTGSYEGTNTADATATSMDIAENTSAYVNGQKINGELPVFDDYIQLAGDPVIEGISMELYRVIPADGILRANCNCRLSTSMTNIARVSGLTADKLKQGENVLGISGNVVELNGTNLNVNPTLNVQNIVPTAPVNGFTQVIVNPVTAAIDNNITPENIKNGVNILGVTGNLDVGINTSDATATASDIALNKTAYVNGSKITGNVLVVNSGEKTYGNGISATAQSYGLDIVANISVDQLLRQNSQFETTALNNTLATAVNLTADKLKKDVTLLGITGNYEGLNTADANATAADIIENKTAYVNGVKLIGTLNTLTQQEYNNALNTVNEILGA